MQLHPGNESLRNTFSFFTCNSSKIAEEEANDAIALLEQTKAAADEAAKAAVQAETDAEDLKSKLTAITEAFNDASREMTKVSARVQ